MHKIIKLDNREITYRVKKNKLSKNLRIRISPCFCDEMGCEMNSNLAILVTLPTKASDSLVEKFLKEKKDWILEKIDEMKSVPSLAKLGDDKKNYKKSKEAARKIIVSRVAYFSELYGFDYKRIAIRSQRTRWGSCSTDGNLNFNYKISFLPIELMDYIIVHELCHLDEFNHSKKFWFLVSEIITDYKNLRKKLKTINM